MKEKQRELHDAYQEHKADLKSFKHKSEAWLLEWIRTSIADEKLESKKLLEKFTGIEEDVWDLETICEDPALSLGYFVSER